MARYEIRSEFFAQIFEDLGIEFDWRRPGYIEQSHALRLDGQPIRLYFNDATSSNPTYFAANEEFYRDFHWEPHWLESRQNTRKERERGHLKRIPYPAEEELALRALVRFARRKLGQVASGTHEKRAQTHRQHSG